MKKLTIACFLVVLGSLSGNAHADENTPRDTPLGALDKNSSIAALNDAIYLKNRLQGSFNESMFTYKALNKISAKKMHLLNMVRRITHTFEATGKESSNQFLTNVVSTQRMPFYLIGMDESETPSEFKPPYASTESSPLFVSFSQSWYDWMLNGGDFQPQFENPDLLSGLMGAKLNSLLSIILIKSENFYNLN